MSDSSTRVVLVPGVLALLPEYAGLQDPVADLRAACHEAVGWLGTDVTVLAGPQGRRVADHLLDSSQRTDGGTSYLAVANGSAKRTEKAPGHVDERAIAFDADLADRLRSGTLAGIDPELSRELWADTAALAGLAEVLPPGCAGTVDYEDDPYGVQYWVTRWQW
jgi:hypothetical protein